MKYTVNTWKLKNGVEMMEAVEALVAVAMDEKVTYAIMHYGEFLYTTTSYDVEQEERLERGLTKLALKSSEEYEGAVYLLSVEKSENNGREDYDLVAVARDGVQL